MNKEHIKQLLKELALTAEYGIDELSCDHMDDEGLIRKFVELEFAGYNAETAYPLVARHIALCADCGQQYTKLIHSGIQERQLIAAYVMAGENGSQAYPLVAHHLTECDACRQDVALMHEIAKDSSPVPVLALDWNRLPPKRTVAIEEIPEAHTNTATTDTATTQSFRERLTQLLSNGPVLTPQLVRGEHALPSSGQEITIPNMNHKFILNIKVQRSGRDMVVVRGSLKPKPDEASPFAGNPLQGRKLHIYQVDPIDMLAQADVDALGTFSFPQKLGARRYVLTVAIDDGDEPLVVLDPRLWK